MNASANRHTGYATDIDNSTLFTVGENFNSNHLVVILSVMPCSYFYQ